MIPLGGGLAAYAGSNGPGELDKSHGTAWEFWEF